MKSFGTKLNTTKHMNVTIPDTGVYGAYITGHTVVRWVAWVLKGKT